MASPIEKDTVEGKNLISIAGVNSDAEIAQLAAQKAVSTAAEPGSSLAALRAQLLADALSNDQQDGSGNNDAASAAL